MLMPQSRPAVTSESFDAILFDMDGVLTDTARVHAECWKKLFDEFLKQRCVVIGETFRPFDIDLDYTHHLDGKPRTEGIADFLGSRGIQLPCGDSRKAGDKTTIHGLGNRKNELVNAALEEQGVEAYNDAVALVRDVRSLGLRTAVVSSSTNCQAVLEAAGIATLFDLRFDGVAASRFGLPGKPAPDTYLKAAEEIGCSPGRSVVIEDAIAGVQAGKAGGFGLVIGVDRNGNGMRLQANGADIVVRDLGQIRREV